MGAHGAGRRPPDPVGLEALRAHCLSKPDTTEGYPFGPGALVLKVAGRVFAIFGVDDDPLTVSVKCDPDLARALRAAYDAVRPGYHLDKRHWNTVRLDGTVSRGEVVAWIDDSYDLVVEKLPRRQRERLAGR